MMERETFPNNPHCSHFRRWREPCPSEASGSAVSDHDFIYNATKAGGSGTEGRQSQGLSGSGSEMDGHLALLLSLTPEMAPEEQRRPRLRWGRWQTLSDNWLPSKANDPLGDILDDVKPKVDGMRQWRDGRGRDRVVSLSEADSSNAEEPRWALNLKSPVKPFRPKYPPPHRSPTPPGIPSFGTPEAIDYTSQFDVCSSLPNGQIPYHDQSSAGRESGRCATESYPQMLRRLFGISSSSSAVPTTTQADRRHGCIVARAEDGTAVQGRFPYRASGHGTNLTRHLQSHSFHHETSVTPSIDDRPCSGSGRLRSVDQQQTEPNEHPRRRARNPFPHANRFSRSQFSSVLPSVPEPLASTFSPRPLSASPMLASPGTNSYYSCVSQQQPNLTVPAYDGGISILCADRINGAYTGVSPPMQSPAPATIIETTQSSESTEPRGTQAVAHWSRHLRAGYTILTEYFPCCSATTDDPASVNGDSSISGDCSRTSGETFVTALDWRETSNRASRISYQSPEPPRPWSILSAWNQGVMERISRPSPLATEPVLT